MDKVIELGDLLEWYGMLLTEHQRSLMSQYANENCSLSEIAEREGISRQAVRDTLSRSEQQLRTFENALHVAERFQKQERLAAAMRRLLEDSELSEESKHLLLRSLDQIEAIWEE